MKFLDALKKEYGQGKNVVIPDIKLFSPKDGDLIKGRDPIVIARELEAAGAKVISVVTEEKEFGGSLGLLHAVSENVGIPILRKDFIESVRDLEETKAAGASAVLLMVSCLGEERLEYLYREAQRIGLEPFVETHNKSGLEFAGRLHAPLVGINNRDILKLEKDNGDVSLTADLMKYAPKDAFIVSESSIRDAADVKKAVRHGASAVLAGTSILKAYDPAEKYKALKSRAGVKICGIMDREGIDICCEENIDIAGIVCSYPVEVPWNIPKKKAAELVSCAGKRIRTCVVTGGNIKSVLELAEAVRPDIIQLHYTETLNETAECAKELSDMGINTVRSIPRDKKKRKSMFGTDDLSETVKMLGDTDIDIILFDSRDAGNAAGTPGVFVGSPEEEADLRTAASASSKLVMAGGGIDGENAEEIIRSGGPDILDVMSGSEDSPGRKSREKIRKITEVLRRS